MARTLQDKMVECLKQNSGSQFTALEIASRIAEKYPAWHKKKAESSTGARGPIEQVAAEIGALRPRPQEKNSKIKVTEDLPCKWYYTEWKSR